MPQLGLGLELGDQHQQAAGSIADGGAPPAGDRLLDFSEELNSMYVALLEDF